MDATNGDSRVGSHSSSRRDDYSSSHRSSRDDHRSSRHDDRYESSRHRDRSDRGDRDLVKREPDDSSHHRSSHRDVRDYASSRGDYSSSRGGYSSSRGENTSSRGEYGSSRGGRVEQDYRSSRDRDSRYDNRRGGSNRFDGPRGGGFGGGFGGGGFNAGGFGPGRDRKRSASPKRPGSNADLTGVVPIDKRVRRLTMWDIKPTGYDHVTAEQAKMSGLFPLPGTPRDPQAPATLQALIQGKPPPTGPASGLAPPPLDVPKLSALNARNSRQARRLVVSRLPPTSTEAEIGHLFNLLISKLNIYKEGSGDPVKDVKKATAGGVAILEFADSSYATTALALDGEIEMFNVQLEIRRPSNYIVQPPPEPDSKLGDTVSKEVPDSTEKLVIKGLPLYLTSEQGLELVEAFGSVQSWILVGEDASESRVPSFLNVANNKGIAFTQFKDPAVTAIALNSLNKMQLNEDHVLSVSYACVGGVSTANAEEDPNGAMGMVCHLAEGREDSRASRVLLLLNMVTGDDLMDADEYDDILQDVKEECDRYGKVLDLQIPRPLGRSAEGPGVGKVFVRFEDQEECRAAIKGIAGRKFAERTVVASYYPEDNYEMSAW